ncbi:MAG: hypothetical protein A2268_11385 [Candidatus Raymondbacteria bacterium RifOxyA12_full_50_37]|nr:MAG: hypothetical protein A2268_11385 [Candidatus Raymondbacteria bacterium RifOxyA12_full_50_37]OGJ92371.1 MAG: hypothetical protein A2248_10510 [Candidatus Raymondbacteria bacterium RIFOXYA2_FULL_49_16]OGJ99352.1 MAG: hypothetical protein A2453_13570 [Candidatus Raymondbacteria bacterium RIFOXYC2_FULL_50_21]OGK02673.1 MAG: hypothetical protein A2487_00940 [Candidatus Raymondbacteria bacterium RifOxyC12_full_50_8]OGP44264.1 MAG: hypothetical protein A2324_04900 [Candidatus Raymondbacteria b
MGSIIFKLATIHSPAMITFLVDRSGVIHDSSPAPERWLKCTRKKIIGKPLSSIVRPLGPSTARYLNLSSLPWKTVCPPELYVQGIHPSFISDMGLFHYSFSSWFTTVGKTRALVFLTPQNYNAPITKKFLSLYRSEETPIIMLDSQFKIVSFNLHFHELIGFAEHDSFYMQSILQLLENAFHSPNPFFFEKRKRYICAAAVRNKGQWHLVADMPCKHPLHIQHRMPHVRVTFPVTVTVPENDVELVIETIASRKGNATIALSHVWTRDPLLAKFENGYYLDIDTAGTRIGNTLVSFCRREATLFSTTVTGQRPRIVVRQTGALLVLNIDGAEIFSYPDPQPIFFRHPVYYSLFLWDGIIELTHFQLWTRPSTFNVAVMERRETPVVAFKAQPGRFFRFTADPVSHLMTQSSLAVRFYPLPVRGQRTRKDYYISLFEEARQYIDAHFHETVDFHALARTCCVCHKYFIRKFKELYEKSPKAYQTTIRMKEAQALLKSGAMNARETGEAVGISDPVNFQKMFRKYVGHNPGDHAKIVQDQLVLSLPSKGLSGQNKALR